MAYDHYLADKADVWGILPIRNSEPGLDSDVFDALKRKGALMTDTDLESLDRNVDVMFGRTISKIGRQPSWIKGRDGKKYLAKRYVDGVHIDPENNAFDPVDRSDSFPLNPGRTAQEMNFVDVLSESLETAQAMQDMYLTSEEKRRRKRTKT